MVLILAMISGILLAMSFFSKEDGTGTFNQRGILTLIVTILLCVCLSIVATAKMWFRHLWKKNSTHDRHKRHTKYHPLMRDSEFREQG